MKKTKKLGSAQKKSTLAPTQVKPERDILDRFWGLVNLIEDQQKHWESVYDEMTSIISEEVDSASFCLKCGKDR